jgi:DNA-binding MarR family transcriptional regulator
MRRTELFGAPLFREPAWDMLLELYSAYERGERLSVSALCYASGVPVTTALRQLRQLEKHGLVQREGDPSDNRRYWVIPTARAISGVATAAVTLVNDILETQPELAATK